MSGRVVAPVPFTGVRVERVPDNRLVPVGSFRPGWLRVNTWQELMTHEREIAERIAQTRNGANLFMANPFMLLTDIGVDLSPEVREEIIRREPRLGALSPTPYTALKNSKDKQKVRYHLHGLFNKETC